MIPSLASFAARRGLLGAAKALAAGPISPSSSVPLSPGARALSASAQARANDLDELDRIHMRGMAFHGHHGVFPEENVLGQKFIADVTLYMDLRPAGLSDDLKDTLDYAAAYAAVRGVVEGGRGRPASASASASAGGGGGNGNGARPCALVERVAQRCADALLAMDARVRAVRVGVRKPHVAVEGVVESLGVEVLRRRQRERGGQEEGAAATRGGGGNGGGGGGGKR